jgi:hypothetical protein
MPPVRRICLTVALCVSLAACGSSGSKSPSTTTAATSGAPGTANAARLLGARVTAAKCMRAQGIDIPDPTAQPGTVLRMISVLTRYPAVKVQSAEQACAAQIRKAFPNATSLTPGQRAQRARESQVFATCIRSHGITSYPDPSAYAGNAPGYLQALSAVVKSPAFKAAAPSCRAQALKDAGG